MVEQVQKSQIDTSQNGIISESEWNEWKTKHGEKGKDYQIVDGNKVLYEGKLEELTNKLSGEFAQPADAEAPSAEQADAKLEQLDAQIQKLQLQIAEAKEAGDEARVEELQQQLADVIATAKLYNNIAKKPLDLSSAEKSAGDAAKKEFTGKAQMASGGQAQGGAKAQSAQGSGGFQAPANWGAQTWGGGSGVPMFNTDAYMKTMAMEQNIMSSWDQVNKNTNRGKQLMQLFFYFAKMAESGDMTSMYQFMKFITYIISKDKAKQQIEMGKKLIQLQELSRSWTNKLLNVQTNTADPAASNELMKTMTIVKSETDAIATSQKLIAQMMEEFAQVVETLTNTTKMALTTAGQVLRTVSKF